MKRHNKVEIGIVGGMIGVVSFCAVGLLSSVSHAETTSANASVTVAEACTMTATVDSAHSATVNPGQYVSEIGQTTLKVVCNDAEGYAIYAVGNANNEYGNNKLLANVGGNPSSTYDIVTGTATSGPTSNWAMKVSAVAGTYAPTIQNSFNNYHDVPTTYTKVAQLSSATDTTTGSSVSTTYAAYVKSDQPAGNYNGKVKYTMVHPASEVPAQPQTTQSGKICYYANATDAVGTMGCQNVSSSVMLLASNFSRNGYGFAGWSDAFDYQTNENAKFYGPQETITLTPADYQSPNNGLSLYAVWVKSAGNLQDTTKVAELCGTGTNALTAASTNGAANLSSVSALTDQRDNQTYAIAKLADGNCWMIENLRLDNSATLTITNTNKPLNDGTNVTLKHNYTDTTTSNSLSSTSNVAYNADTAPDGWCTDDSTACDDQSRLRTDNTTNRVTYNENQNVTSQDANIYSYGNYYNWYSATAGRGTYDFGTTNNSVAGDLCPAGWHLPIGGSSANATNSDFWQLGLGIMGFTPANNSAYKTSETNSAGKTAPQAFRSYPNNFIYSGFVLGGSVSNRNSIAFLWSSTTNSSSNAYSLSMYTSSVSPGTNGSNYKYNGWPVRCVAPSA